MVAARKAQHEKSQKQEMQEMLCKLQKILEITKLTKSNSLVVLMSEKKVRTSSKTLVHSYKRLVQFTKSETQYIFTKYKLAHHVR